MADLPNEARGNAGKSRQTPARNGAPGRLGATRLVFLLLMLFLPALALNRLCDAYDWRLVLGIALVVSVLSFWVCRADKKSAQAGAWRTSEAALHMLELLGGWPGSYLAQRLYRHKISKSGYQFVFWVIVIFYQLLAFDYLQSWLWARALWHAVTQAL